MRENGPEGAPEGHGRAPRADLQYLRASIDRQGVSGLGLEAQRDAVDRHVRSVGGRVLSEHIEIESGKKNDRPELAKAIAAARARRAVLVIAKLDRLARNLHFVTGLQEAGVDFVACDNPHATKLMVHMLVAFAEHEREQISIRTKAALQAAKARGAKLGNPRLKAGDKASAQAAANAKSRKARRRATELMPFIEAAQKAGWITLGQLAEAMTARGIKTPGGGPAWTATTVRPVLKKAENL